MGKNKNSPILVQKQIERLYIKKKIRTQKNVDIRQVSFEENCLGFNQ